MFADAEIQPGVTHDAFLHSEGLVRASASTDFSPATATLSALPDSVSALSQINITGTAADVGGKVAAVEVSTDAGRTWMAASGANTWNFSWTPSKHKRLHGRGQGDR